MIWKPLILPNSFDEIFNFQEEDDFYTNSLYHDTQSLVKAAQRNLVQSLALTYGNQGVHVGMVLAGGPVGPEEKERNPKNIAAKAWEWFAGGEKAGFEVLIP